MTTRDEIQSQAITAIISERNRGIRSTLLQMPTQTGKAQPLDSKVLTPFGWRAMGEVCIGDLVIGSDGGSYFVTGVFPQGMKEVFRLTFSDGASVECCDDHLWKVKDRKLDVRRVGFEGVWKVFPTSALRQNVVHRDGNWRWSIPMVSPIKFTPPQHDVHWVDPYLMGVLLGDGGLSGAGVNFCNPEAEIKQMVRSVLPAGVSMVPHAGDDDGLNYGLRSEFGSPNPLRRSLAHYELMGCKSVDKHIPDDYLFASLDDRVSLLQGLLDTDGSVSRFSIEYCTSSSRLAEDMRFLVESLGGRVSSKVRVPHYTHKGERREGSPSHRMIVTLPRSITPFRLTRKREAYIPKTKYQPHRAIVAIELVGIKECQCISVSAPDSLYVTDHCVLTHNTRTACKLIRRGIEEWNARYLVCAHMGELLDQFGRELDQIGIKYCVEKAEQKAFDWMSFDESIRVCLGSKDTLQNRGKSNRLAAWPHNFFTDIIEDECDLAVADTWKRVRDHFSSAFRLGLTATVDRLDGVPLSTIFESTAYTYGIKDAIRNGHRVPYRGVECDTDIDIRGIRANRKGELNPGRVEERIAPKLNDIANIVRKHLDRLKVQKAIAFLPDRATAYMFAEILTKVGVDAKGVCGENPARRQIVDGHRQGDFRVLCNAKLFGRGHNDPAIEAVIHLRPTTSRALYDQMSGRCGATKEGKECGYLFYVGWQTDLDLIGPTDIFAEGCDSRVRERARKKAKERKDADPLALLEEARQEVAFEDRRRLRYTPSRRDVRHQWREFDPIGIAARSGIQVADLPGNSVQDPVLVARLKELGLKDVRGLSNEALRAMDRLWTDRKIAGMSTLAQYRYLVQRQYPPGQVLDMTSNEASRAIGRLHQGVG